MSEETKNTEEASSPVSNEGSKSAMTSNPKMLGGIVAVGIAILVILIVGIVMISRGGGGTEIGTDIPEGYDLVDRENYEIGIPAEGWQSEEQFTGFVIEKISEATEDSFGIGEKSVTIQYQEAVDTSDLSDEEKEALDAFQNLDCSKIEDEFTSSSENLIEGISGNSRSIKINGLKGCEIIIEAGIEGIQLNTISYILSEPNGDGSFVISTVLSGQDITQDEINEYLEIARTFRAN